jgi:dipeptidyl aminopeptidase/acylaminoacyl peptidase
MIHASDDPAVPVLNSMKMYEALKKAGVEKCSLHIFPFGKHAIALRHQPGSTALWPEIAEEWMKEIGVF